MSDEDLNANPLFVAFLASNWFKQAAQQQLIIAVPPKQALTAIKINNEVIENHILKQSPYYQDEYITVNGKSVSYSSSQLTCKQSGMWNYDRVITIQAQELYYDDQFESFSVLRVTMPLDGKVNDDYLLSLEASSGNDLSRPERRSISQHEQLLVRLTGDSIKDSNSIFASIHKFVVQFNSSYVLVKGFIEHAGQKVRDACTRLSEEAIIKVRSLHRDVLISRPVLQDEIHWAIESIVMQHIHKKLFTGLCELYRSEEDSIQTLVASLRNASQHDLGVRDDIVCQPNVAISLLADLGSFQTPLRKLAQLENVSRALTQAVRQQASQRTGAKDTVLSAEDIIPLTLYALVQSNLPNIYAHLQYLLHFAPNRSIGSLDHVFVHLANFHAAVQLIQSGALMHATSSVSVVSNTRPSQSLNQVSNGVADRVSRGRSVKIASHQRNMSTNLAIQSITNHNSAFLNGSRTAVARIPSRSPTRSFSVVQDPVSMIRTQHVSRAASISSSSDRPVESIRVNRRTVPLPSDASRSQENRLGDFLLGLKNADSNVVVGTFEQRSG